MLPILRLVRLTPATAEITVDSADPTVELRGRIVGPKCAYSTTVEVAYPIRGNRVVIPEPAWWDIETPFLYWCRVEGWRDGRTLGETHLRFGLAHTRRNGRHVTCNGRVVELNAYRPASIDVATFRAIRSAGGNAIELPAHRAPEAWDYADYVGLFVIADGPVVADTLHHPSALN